MGTSTRRVRTGPRTDRSTSLGPSPHHPAPLGKLEIAAVAGFLFLLFSEHLLFGGGNTAVSLPFAALYGLALVLVLTTRPRLKALVSEARDLWAPGFAFLGVLAASIWALTPYAPGGPNPIWAYVGVRGAAVLDRSAAFIQLIQLGATVCCFLLGYSVGARSARARLFLKGAATCAAAYAAWAFLSYVAAPDTVFGLAKRVHTVRLTASFVSANTAGCFLALCATLGLTWLLADLHAARPRTPEGVLRATAIPAAIVLIIGVALVLTASRGAVAACAVATVLLLGWHFLSGRSRQSMALGLLAAVVVTGGLVLASRTGAVLVERSGDIAEDARARLILLSTHWEAFCASPWAGYGLGSFHKVNQLLITSQTYDLVWNVRAAHNVYLQWLEEAGVLGATPMFACIGLLLLLLIAGAFNRGRMTIWIKGLAACSLVLLLHGASDYALQLPSIQAFWATLLGIGCALAANPARAGAASRGKDPVSAAARAPRLAPLIGWLPVGAGALIAAASLWFWLALELQSPPALVAAAPLAEAAGAAADRLMAGQSGLTGRGAAVAQARVLTMKELGLSPASGAGWARLASIDAERSGGLNAEAARDLERSYAVAPLDPSLIPRRIPFAYKYWSEVSVQTRNDTLRQIELGWTEPAQRALLLRTLPTIGSYGGQVAYGMKLSSLRLLSRVEARRQINRTSQSEGPDGSNRAR